MFLEEQKDYSEVGKHRELKATGARHIHHFSQGTCCLAN